MPLPVFAFANAGISYAEIGVDDLTNTVTLGIALGLFLGNPIGILSLIFVATRLRRLRLLDDVTWSQLTGTAFACGIGFTMSLFMASLVFEHADGSFWAADKLGILMGAIASALVGGIILAVSLPRNTRERQG